MSVVKCRRSAFFRISSDRPGSKMGTSPVDVVAQLREAGSGDETDPAGPDDSDRFALRHDG
jgi:hypothetical protein